MNRIHPTQPNAPKKPKRSKLSQFMSIFRSKKSIKKMKRANKKYNSRIEEEHRRRMADNDAHLVEKRKARDRMIEADNERRLFEVKTRTDIPSEFWVHVAQENRKREIMERHKINIVIAKETIAYEKKTYRPGYESKAMEADVLRLYVDAFTLECPIALERIRLAQLEIKEIDRCAKLEHINNAINNAINK